MRSRSVTKGQSHFPITPNSSVSSRFLIPDFLTIPVLTQSLIVETTPLDLPPSLPPLPYLPHFYSYSLNLSILLLSYTIGL
ncbi:MAG: hypothetical protein F6J90_29870 [Moorea sp. SIOASIH]|uniref:hypothetical protein n=1 Tax=Moorena sp. SIOASIH TaxID=2607817 RepID=UPI0013BBF594|nr:hypothetical protein [Moorena sp. SIOASIH]NEO40327.1 hypothetical protein [Moorena sp. SIOASIH]